MGDIVSGSRYIMWSGEARIECFLLYHANRVTVGLLWICDNGKSDVGGFICL